MRAEHLPRAEQAAVTVASAAGLRVDDATTIHASNRIAVRLLPAGVLARVAYEAHEADAAFEVEVARRLAQTGSPVGALDPRVEPRVVVHDGFAVTLWTYYDCLPSEISPTEYARALVRLHAGMREVEMSTPRFTDRVAEARTSLGDRELTPELGEADRRLLDDTLRGLAASITARGGGEQLLHGEPHVGNLLNTRVGPLFVDLGTCCRGPVEFDIAHAPDGVSEHYPGADADLIEECRILMRAMVITWRWERDDELPDGRRLAHEWMTGLRAALADRGL